MFIWEFAANPIMDALIDWSYGQMIGFLGNFFAEMGGMGVELFEMPWVQTIILFFSQLAWALFGVSLVVSGFECGIEYASGRGNIQQAALNAIKGFMAVNLFTVVPVRLYSLSVTLQGTFAGCPLPCPAKRFATGLAGLSERSPDNPARAPATDSEKLPERLPLSQQKEFKTVRNMVIREVLKLSTSETESEEDMSEDTPISDNPEQTAPAPVTTEPVSSSASEERHKTTVSGAAVARMLRHMGNIFRDNTARNNTYLGTHIDRKRRKALMDKRLAMGHKADDHEGIGQKPVT